MKRLTGLVLEALRERGAWCGTSTAKDEELILRRVEHEGISFLTISLPAFGKDFEKSLDQGKVDRSLFQGFTWKGGLPRFMGGFLGLVFDRASGILIDDPSIEAIRAIRQITLMCGKVNIDCSQERIDAAIQQYVDVEQEVRRHDAARTPDMYSAFKRVGVLLWADIFSKIDRKVYEGKLIPRHGPGSTADRLLGNQKYDQSEWPQRLEPYFPSWEYLIPNERFVSNLDRVNFLEPRDERPVKVITVPKTLKTPRIIAMEPTAMQYAQQALKAEIYEEVERDDTLRSLVGFMDQEPNRFLAWKGSFSGNLATLDMSEASDRVFNQLVRTLLENHPHLSGAVDACRSRKADVRGHGIIRLAKFASMGSALCFPIEAMIFATIIFLGIQKDLGRPLTRRDIKSYRGQVRVFGDDIIVPVDHVQSVIQELEAFGLRVNLGKSFWTGKFRESCGKEYYDGEDVSIVRVRALLPTSRKDATELVSTVSLRNQLYKAGSWRTVHFLDSRIRKVIPFPIVSEDSPVLGRHSFLPFEPERTETGKSLQRPLVRGATVRTRLPRNAVDGESALLKYFLTRDRSEWIEPDDAERRTSVDYLSLLRSIDSLPAADKEHLERSGRPDSVSITIRWAPVA